jgi:hypothetical protein
MRIMQPQEITYESAAPKLNIDELSARDSAREVIMQTPDEIHEEGRKLRRLQLMMNMVMSVIGQSSNLTVEQAAEMVADSRQAALAMFPEKELAFNLLYKPRLQRLMRERFHLQ